MEIQTTMFDDQPAQGEYLVPTGEPGRCASCGAAIIWTRTEAGKAIPLDLGHVRSIGEQRYALTHFATCPHGRDWRKK